MNDETTSFRDLYKTYADDVLRFSYWLCGDRDDAKDITSETFARALTADTPIRLESVKGYLFAIARNFYLQSLRRNRRHSPITDELPDTDQRPDHAAEVASEVEETMRALQSLPEIDRTVLIMMAREEIPYEEIARLTGLSLSAVKVKVFRARIKLNAILKHQRGE